jgi:tetratricopeptide (TPR) repeat protein
MLQTLREYALERLERTGEAHELRRAHADWFVELLRAEALRPPGWPNERSLKRVAPERENFAAALEWAYNSGLIETVAQLVAPLVGVWVVTGQLHEAERWLTRVLEHGGRYSGRLAAEVASAARAFAWHRGEHAEAQTLAERALVLWRKARDDEAIGREMLSLGNASCARGDPVDGRAAHERTIQFAREHELTEILSSALISLGDLEIQEGRLEAARAVCEESRAAAAPGSDNAAVALVNLTYLAMVEGRHADATSLCHEALEGALRNKAPLTIAWTTIAAAWPLATHGELEWSASLLGSGLAFLDRAGARKEWMDDACEAEVCNILREHFDQQTVDALLEEAQGTSPEEAGRRALEESRVLRNARAP